VTPADLQHALYAAAHAPEQRDELGRAAAAWFDGEPTEDGWADFVDFFALEWVDTAGGTLLEQVVGEPLTALAWRWLTGVRSGVFVVDESDGAIAFCRDAASEEELCLVVGESLAPRSVIQGRLLPDDKGRFHVSGDPDVYEPLRVIARLGLVRAWLESPRRALCEQLAKLRAGFLRQRLQRQAFVAFFGSDQLLFPSALELEQHLNGFLDHLLFRYQPPALKGQTLAQVHTQRTGEDAVQVKVELGESLSGPGAVGVIYDAQEGIHFLPAFDAFVAHMQGRAEHPDVVRSYLEDPGVTALPFRRVGGTHRLAALLGSSETELETLLAPFKGLAGPAAPSVLPHFDG
jgi:hypothetical protein